MRHVETDREAELRRQAFPSWSLGTRTTRKGNEEEVTTNLTNQDRNANPIANDNWCDVLNLDSQRIKHYELVRLVLGMSPAILDVSSKLRRLDLLFGS
jgi:hypothetical protein